MGVVSTGHCYRVQVGGGDLAGTIEFVHPKSKWKLGDRVIAATKGWRWEDLDYGNHPQKTQETPLLKVEAGPPSLVHKHNLEGVGL